jgi:CheY-like chemotaxis protein
MLTSYPEFLIVDDHVDNRFLLTKTLIRKFPRALILECRDSVAALQAVKRPNLTAVIVHRADDVDGLPLIEMLRNENRSVPILYVSTTRREEAFAAGASAFLNYDAWLRVGSAVEDMLRTTDLGLARPTA